MLLMNRCCQIVIVWMENVEICQEKIGIINNQYCWHYNQNESELKLLKAYFKGLDTVTHCKNIIVFLKLYQLLE